MLFVSIATLSIIALIAVGVLMVGVLLHLSRKRADGMVHLIVPGIVLSNVALVLTSGRDISDGFSQVLTSMEASGGALNAWIFRLVSITCLAISFERLANAMIRKSQGGAFFVSPATLFLCFILFWVFTTLTPATLAENARFTHDLIYPMLFGLAFLLVGSAGFDKVLTYTRDVLFMMAVMGLLVLLVKPGLVMDFAYVQGLIPGMPRYSGLTAHAVSMGFVSLVSLVVLLARPYKSSSLNVIASIVFLFGLFFSQSKTSWLSAIACVLFLGVTSYRQAFLRFIANPKHPLIGAGLVGVFLAVVVGMGFVFLFADLGRQFREFAASSEGASIVTLTERDVIWNVAFDEWARNPWLGYGSELFGVLHRMSIGMPHATSGHNQFVDTLARSGILGFSALVVYIACLAFWIFKYTRNNRVLPALLFLVLLLRCVTEVPLAMDGYSLEFFCHLLLLGAVTAAHSEETAALTQNLKIKNRYTQHTPSVDVQLAVGSVFAGSERV